MDSLTPPTPGLLCLLGIGIGIGNGIVSDALSLPLSPHPTPYHDQVMSRASACSDENE